ncbi:hypothetical protein SADUNF_Sadunf03G0002400 [Salix dunnii]|uniref:Uncharacterized protein n=1 Tax=Salix dunnii TaxID=1413687 RepID=A0A835N442_9ROSI|nr:hypothetical protein SADUNF_Sadunf03G0002400 [Salix dunnii]
MRGRTIHSAAFDGGISWIALARQKRLFEAVIWCVSFGLANFCLLTWLWSSLLECMMMTNCYG